MLRPVALRQFCRVVFEFVRVVLKTKAGLMSNSVHRSMSNPRVSVASVPVVASASVSSLRPVEFVALGEAAALVLQSLKTKVEERSRA